MESKFTDTHCHVHAMDGSLDDNVAKRWSDVGMTADEVINAARQKGVEYLICVGTDLKDSQIAVDFASRRENVWASVGVHPHDATRFMADPSQADSLDALVEKNISEVVAIGECGLDYYYENSSKVDQQAMLRLHLALAQKYDLPLIFHIRDAFEDFWPIYDEYAAKKPLAGVVHSFTAHHKELEQALQRGLYVALNGIVTFTKDELQIDAAKKVPLDRLLLETDAPYLTPKPFRGKICKPEHVLTTAQFLSTLRGESLETIAVATTKNAQQLFAIK